MFKAMVIAVATVSLLDSASAHAATKTLAGDYTLSFVDDPGSIKGPEYCLALATDNGIAGFPESGTFADTGGEGLTGQYIVYGKTLTLTILVTPFGDNVALIGAAKSKGYQGTFDDFDSGNNGGSNTVIAGGTFKLEPGCTADAAASVHAGQIGVTR
jgi:hypothetical protein